ncbi:2-oxoglutarate dehydrogenase E2 component [Neoasaia chiangmaiensis NBRC 101099]|uniref:Dihydrolipoyllysine-residue succinyltransferase component of 2-oxoglutarate dehydrogenase complex n=1 Tax=Neoasaia chiangmaiensis TaxID=320497 RepID=A0A1U9KLX4_9PROT|nr:2-oxoglutarate dehydrogenase complex dihydrolipoyllysine-residue succinyltransferase [Neoasaia chiangmaiensis]AQS86793.1 dihydrolipoamide succinyltransferase [Neoasaia chiangmaiensis]GBR35425.1 2-oxoglutarate dehydrogenase E2 component [Neoasaia chiangmaiensis NBRC 101099]GEN16345.1 dihydrolipoyllysine-residue succinyltransferase component of 2-oxoglutarate dehydrogenase complex [Neoasaia chiangmaiensis]
MSAEIKVPVLGESVTSATITRWLKQPGDLVAVDDPVVELETDKISVEVPSIAAGTLGAHAVEAGADVAVGALLTTVDQQGSPTAAETAAKTGKTTEPASQSPPPVATQPPAVSPMPAAARMMEENAVQADAIGAGSGLGGRVTKGDVLAFLEQNNPSSKPDEPAVKAPETRAPASTEDRTDMPRQSSAGHVVAQSDRERRVPMTRLRQTIARRLKEAQNTAAMLTTFNEVDMSAAKALRADYRDVFEKKHGVRLGFMSIFARAVIEALQEFPAINAEIDGDDVIYRQFVNLGIAVGSERGLVVPVLHDAETLSFAELEKKISDYGKRARNGTLKLDELSRGTFSITNGGVFGSLLSTPILNAPQSAILGMHAIQDRPVALDGQVVIRPMMYVALSYDHRLVDGREAVSFLVRVKQYVEDPRRLLLDV